MKKRASKRVSAAGNGPRSKAKPKAKAQPRGRQSSEAYGFVPSADSLNGILNAMDDPVFVKDEKHRWVLLNDKLCAFLGRSRTDLLGKSDYDLSPKKEADVFWQRDSYVLKTGKPDINEEPVTWRGEPHTLLTMKSLYVDPATQRRFIVGVIRDITERKHIEQERERLMHTVELHSRELEKANTELIALRAKEEEYLNSVRRELDTARRIQADFLPRSIPQAAGWDISAFFKSAREVAGDLYDVFELPGAKIGVAVADICGKSIGAALYVALIRTLLRSLASQQPDTDPAGIVTFINDYVIEHHLHAVPYMYVTLFYGVVDTRTGNIEFVNAGHLPPLVVSAKQVSRLDGPRGPAIGLAAGTRYASAADLLKPGHTLLVYTDGLTEARRQEGIMLTVDELCLAVQMLPRRPQELLDALAEKLLPSGQDKELADDVTMVAMKRSDA